MQTLEGGPFLLSDWCLDPCSTYRLLEMFTKCEFKHTPECLYYLTSADPLQLDNKSQ